MRNGFAGDGAAAPTLHSFKLKLTMKKTDVDYAVLHDMTLTKEQIQSGVKSDLALAFEVIAVCSMDERVQKVIVEVFWERYEKLKANHNNGKQEVPKTNG